MAPTPGILYVTMQPEPTLPESQFHDWYNNEHGPTRLRLPFVSNGFRYRANDLGGSAPSASKPEWMAVYDIPDMAELTKETYLRLREQPVKSQREADAMKQIAVGRKLFDFVESRESASFKKLEDVGNEGQGNVQVAVFIDLQPGQENEKKLGEWYAGEHVDLLSKVPGWLRTRRFVTSSIDPNSPVEYLALHDYAPRNGLEGPEFKAATTTKWTNDIMATVVKEKRRRVYDLYYTFGPAPRHLAPKLADWQSSDVKASLTRTFPTSTSGISGAIESFITTKDGVELQFRLEGSEDPHAPLIVLSNSILVDWGIWDGFIKSFFSSPKNKKYRILRYLTRGRTARIGSTPVTLDVLASDIITLLDVLRVKSAAAAIGVSLGGATVLNTALKYPSRIASCISCDTSSKSPAGNSKAWSDRIAVSEKEGAVSASTHETIVGQELAELTTRRWFVKESYEDNALAPTLEVVKQMVAANSLEGFRQSVRALWEYDMTEAMKRSEVKALFVVGASDGVLPATMKAMAEAYGQSGAAYRALDAAGHLPMVEKPAEFAEIVAAFLE